MKRILSAILLSVYVFVSCAVSFSVYATNEDITQNTVSDELIADSSASSVIDEPDASSDSQTSEIETNVDSSETQIDSKKLSAKESFLSHKEEYMNTLKKMLSIAAEDNPEYFLTDFMVTITCLIYGDYRTGVDPRKYNITDEMYDEICNFVSRFYDFVSERVVFEYTTEEEIEEIKRCIDEALPAHIGLMDSFKQHYISVSFRADPYGNKIERDYRSIEVLGEHYLRLYIDKSYYFYVEDFHEIVKFIQDNYFSKGIYYKLTNTNHDNHSHFYTQKFDYDACLYNSHEVDIIDKLTFDVKVEEKHMHTFLEFLADPGSTIKCRVVQATSKDKGNINKFILTAEGSRSTMEFGTTAPSGFGYDGTYNFMDFGPIRLTGKTVGNDIRSINFALRYSNVTVLPSVPTENMKYEFYYEGNTLAERRAMYKLFGISKDNIIVPLKEEQDPEYYITKMKNSYELFGEQFVTDYKINFIAVMPIDVSAKAAPDWYAKLGDDVKATILGISSTLNGEERSCYTMVKFEGSKNHIWFDMLSGSHKINWSKTDYTADDILEVKLEYDSLLSFDGEEKIQNTLDKEYFDARMYFSHEDFSIKSIEFDIGLATDTVTSDEINYIGGGKAVYEKIM
ncbi:MAG: hypothetical protein E7395_06935 [Ruminococcaceae bacterium]|nr:hypothetical protein [Oscillospiraceae bacterium]